MNLIAIFVLDTAVAVLALTLVLCIPLGLFTRFLLFRRLRLALLQEVGEDGRPRGEDAPVYVERLSPGLEDEVGALLVVDQAPEIGGQRVVLGVVEEEPEPADELDVAVGVDVLVGDGDVLVPDRAQVARVLQGQVALDLGTADLELPVDAVENAELELDPDALGLGLVDLTPEHVEAEHEGVGQPLAVLAGPEADGEAPRGVDAVQVDVERPRVEAAVAGAVGGVLAAVVEPVQTGLGGGAALGQLEEVLDGPVELELDVRGDGGGDLEAAFVVAVTVGRVEATFSPV